MPWPYGGVSDSLTVAVCMFINPALTPESSTQDLRVEPLLVLADLRRVAGRARVDRVDVDNGAFTGRVGLQRVCQASIRPKCCWRGHTEVRLDAVVYSNINEQPGAWFKRMPLLSVGLTSLS